LKTKRVEFEGATKQELHDKITALLNKYDDEIKKNNISITRNGDVYNVSGSIKKFVFTFSVKAEIELNDNYLDIRYDTDVPESFQEQGIETLKSEIKEIKIR
jgi:hypothetical protein